MKFNASITFKFALLGGLSILLSRTGRALRLLWGVKETHPMRLLFEKNGSVKTLPGLSSNRTYLPGGYQTHMEKGLVGGTSGIMLIAALVAPDGTLTSVLN